MGFDHGRHERAIISTYSLRPRTRDMFPGPVGRSLMFQTSRIKDCTLSPNEVLIVMEGFLLNYSHFEEFQCHRKRSLRSQFKSLQARLGALSQALDW